MTMTVGFFIQLALVVAMVCVSALYMLGQLVPKWRIAVGTHLQQTRYPAWMVSLGRRLAGASGCGSGCETCGSCAPPKKDASGVSAAPK